MKYRFLFSLLFLSNLITAQTIIKGMVYIDNKPIEGAAVYFNNTMIGSTTNNKGEFSFKIKDGQYQLIVSYLGFKKISYNLNTTEFKESLRFNLVEEANTLDEIIIKKTIYDDEWKYNLAVFKTAIIGETALSKDCKILNPDVLHFEYNARENILTAFARKPLQLKHKGLGYLIIYELEIFEKIKIMFAI
jgi:hypothetical protein